MYEAWAHDPSSVHASWDSYFRYTVLNSRSDSCVSRGGAYQAPPSLGNTTNPNEIALASMGGSMPGMGGGAPSAEIIEAHLAVQGTIRSYQVNRFPQKNIVTVAFPRCEAIWLPRSIPWG